MRDLDRIVLKIIKVLFKISEHLKIKTIMYLCFYCVAYKMLSIPVSVGSVQSLRAYCCARSLTGGCGAAGCGHPVGGGGGSYSEWRFFFLL